MVKRKPSVGSDLRTNSVALSLQRYDTKSLKAQNWGIQHLQPFFPAIQKLFKTEVRDSPQEFGFRVTEGIATIIDSESIRTTKGNTVPVHRKTTMLLSPFKWMQGDYGTSIGLPTTEDESAEIWRKIQDPNNAAYVGALLSVVLAQSGCPHFPKVYGVFTGVSEKHTIDISDDYADLSERSWFSSNIGKTFDVKVSDEVHTGFSHTRGARASVLLGEDIALEGVEELAVDDVSAEPAEMNQMMHDSDEEDDDESDSSSVSTSYVFGMKSCECDSDEEVEECDDEDDEPFAWASFTNVPVQITVMEKCTGTFHELCSENPEPEKHLAWLSQVMFALAYAQRNYGFTHNDLHSNNVMYIPTDREFMYYNCGGFYRVPTYGYLIKIIDFERGIGSVKVIGMKEPKLFMSDHFSVNEEAGGQYNFEPWYMSKHPEIKPNPSFDLVRLATSMFWDLFPEGPQCLDYRDNQVFKFFMKWLTIGDESVLFGKKDPHHDRYHGFYLYKAITRYCKNAVPRTEISSLKMYVIDSLPQGEECCLID
jgi:hypothetical protein